jgi:hypothetical protein
MTTWNNIMGYISTAALFMPVLFILLFRLGTYRSFPVLLFYYTTVLMYNIFTQGYIKADRELIYYWGLFNNLLDAPLMLYFLTYLSTSKKMLHRMKVLILSYILFEAVVISVNGLNINSIIIILAPGIILVIYYCIIFFNKYAKYAIRHYKATGKAMIASSLLFAYGCYSFLYLMYYVFKAHLDSNNKPDPQYLNDTFLIYFMITTFSSLLISAGIIIESKRVHKLKELKVTRKELATIYTETRRTAPFRKVLLDFDKEHWN